MGFFEWSVQGMQSLGFFHFLAAFFIFIVIYLTLTIYWKRKKNELKLWAKILFFIISISIAAAFLIFSTAGTTSEFFAFISLFIFVIFFIIVLIFLIAALLGMKPKDVIKMFKKQSI